VWLYIPKPSASAQASEVSTSPPAWCSELAPSVMWRGKQRPWKSWQRAFRTAPWTMRLFGRMPDPSTANHGAARWISSQPDTLASHSVSPDGDWPKPTPGTSGPTSSGSSERFNQLSLFSKMSKDTSSEGSTRSSTTLTSWGSMRSGAYTQRPKPELHTGGTACSSWPTAVTSDSRSAGRHSTTTGVMHPGTTLTDACRQWPTPRAMTGGAESADRKKELGRTASGGGDLQSAAAQWPTPNASVVNDGESVESFLARQKKWAHKYHNSMPLTVKAKQWATPTARDHKDGTEPSDKAPTNGLLGRQAPRVIGAISPSTSGRQLNPLFVEALMGFPVGWTDCAPLATLCALPKQS